MTSSKLMTRQELMELAALDAFGLLDEYEAALYTRSFHDAPAGVQDEIIELQAELISDESLLPDSQPSPELRQRVLEAVAKAIEAETAHLNPLASIGRQRNAVGDIIGQIPLGRSGQFWRAAAFVLAGAVVVISFFWSEATRHGQTIAQLALIKATSAELKEMIGPTWEDFVGNPNCRWIELRPLDSRQPGMIAVLVNEETNEAFMLAMGLPEDAKPYTLSMQQGGETTDLGEIRSDGLVAARRLDGIDPVKLASAVLLVTGNNGKVLFRSA
ncbi:MAG: hypothetical protein JSV91_11670 [Phycisphaerales bacterium]|nr:MAG: hypothetical protein JSV91_11670 [Phycisphaerales bacterium]